MSELCLLIEGQRLACQLLDEVGVSLPDLEADTRQALIHRPR